MKRIFVSITLVVTLVAVCLPASAQPNTSIADVSASRISFEPAVQGESYSMTVSGPKGFYQQEKFTGATPVFELFDAQGQLLPDGVYTFEVTVEPSISPALRAEMTAARDHGADKALAARLPEAVTYSGSFSIADGAFVNPYLTEENPQLAEFGGEPSLAERATVLATNDGVIKFSLCVGGDCPNSPNFGDTTILMMENNNRIKFDDTSNSGSFPNQDWELEANESTNGGANWFAIFNCGTSSQGGCGGNRVFTAEAGARNNALYVEADGDIGIGTNSPAVNIDIKEGNTPTLRLQQDTSSGFAALTWDVAGNETNFFIRNVTNGSRLPFRIFDQAVDNNLVLDDQGEVGIRTETPSDYLEVNVNNGNGGITVSSGSDLPQVTIHNTAVTNDDGKWRYRATAQGEFNVIHADADSTVPFKIEPESITNLMVLSGNEVQIGTTGAGNDAILRVEGEVIVNNTTVHPDYVFEPDYALLSIEEQGQYMFANKHLPAVGKAAAGADGRPQLSIVDHQLGMLEELEKAHLYINQLNGTIQNLEQDKQELADELEQLKDSFEQRLQALEAAQR